ncbi:Hypothetical predicted protein [Marmota monax]|uniref:Uncharacterized protein n=1 Tax=Marmota monax TaxID=9995 RepID=A0A5E4B0Y3_MARMO|nr:Hypothetical predicted protein [Marmota monax]
MLAISPRASPRECTLSKAGQTKEIKYSEKGTAKKTFLLWWWWFKKSQIIQGTPLEGKEKSIQTLVPTICGEKKKVFQGRGVLLPGAEKRSLGHLPRPNVSTYRGPAREVQLAGCLPPLGRRVHLTGVDTQIRHTGVAESQKRKRLAGCCGVLAAAVLLGAREPPLRPRSHVSRACTTTWAAWALAYPDLPAGGQFPLPKVSSSWGKPEPEQLAPGLSACCPLGTTVRPGLAFEDQRALLPVQCQRLA